MSIAALIVDDEPLARSRVRHLLKSHQDVDVVGECGNGGEAVELIAHEHPDLVFLDIEMPRANAFEALREVTPGQQPVIVFTTAHEEFALDAFDISAADYLVKPFDQERFDRALDRARRLLSGEPRPTVREATRRRRDRFAVKRRGEIIFIKASQIDWIQAEGNYSRLHAGDASFLLRESMQSLDETLDDTTFVRVHRSAIVNLDRVQKIVAGTEAAYAIVLHGGATVPLGPSFRSRLEELLGQKL
jgi:two-component system LytT family response regulator